MTSWEVAGLRQACLAVTGNHPTPKISVTASGEILIADGRRGSRRFFGRGEPNPRTLCGAMKGNRSLRPPCTDIERRQIEDIEMAVRDLGDALPPRRGSDDLISDDLILLDRGAVGCRGVLVVRRTGQLICLGSHCGAEEFAWAYHRGIPIDDANATSTLIITSVADHERVERLLRMFLRADYVRREVVPELAKMPLVLPGVMLYFVIPDLKEAVEEGWFEFEIEHSGEAPPNVASTRSPFRE